MFNDNTKHNFKVIERSNKKLEEYIIAEYTDQQMSKYLKMKQDCYGYVEGIGGDKSYSIVAWYNI